ncbi:MAG: low molecular weight phosphotyrosine protein phosphatase [Muribaculaceae bacterium]|nr:low molecular weight phosphotyrosine protein phosphatase [Muribaculaceae bacterium]
MTYDSEYLASLRDKKDLSVLFVCLGNICRSPAAEGLMKAVVEEAGDSDRWYIDSAGTGGYHTGDLPDPRMRAHASRRGYNLTHRARKVLEQDFRRFDLIIPMDSANEDYLRRLAPTAEAERKIVPMINFVTLPTRFDHIPDPYYEGAEGFELVLDLLENGTANLHAQLTD